VDKALLNVLERITAEEQKILNGNKEVEKSNYTDRNEFIVERNRMLAAGELITAVNLRTANKTAQKPRIKFMQNAN